MELITIVAALAALCNGADALYLGASAFGARATAGFDRDSLKEIIDLCHAYGRRVHVTVNTLVKERELDGVRETLRMLRDLRADAAGLLAASRPETWVMPARLRPIYLRAPQAVRERERKLAK